MANLMKIYINNPTADGTDGTAASEGGVQTNPIAADLAVTDTDAAEVAVKCALRCDSGYKTTGNTTLKFVNSLGNDYTSDNYKLAKDDSYANGAAAIAGATWSDTLAYTESLGATNTIFWVKLKAAAGTAPTNDTSISLKHEETVESVV